MIDKNAKNINHPSQLAIILGLTLGGFLASLVLSALIWLMMEGAVVPSTPEEMLQPKFYNVLMVLQAVSTFLIFFIPACLFAIICYKRPAKFLGFNLNINLAQVLLAIGILILAFPLSGALGELNEKLPIPQNWAVKFRSWEISREAEEAALIQINTFPKYLISLLIIGLLPALFEETYFRATIQNLFTRWFKGPWVAIILTSLIFSGIHGSYYGFLVRFGLGAILGSVFYYSGSLWLSILIHFLFNSIQVTQLYEMKGLKQAKDVQQNFPLWMGVAALLLLIFLFTVFKRISASRLAKYPEAEYSKETTVSDDDFQNWLNKS